MKKVLVLMSTYNGEKWLKEQIDSILASREVKVDILVRDDGSSDNTLSILNLYKNNNRLNYYVGENIGPAQSFRDLVDRCEFGYDAYAYADQDDIWSEKKLFYATEALEKTDTPYLWECGLRRFGNETGGGLLGRACK